MDFFFNNAVFSESWKRGAKVWQECAPGTSDMTAKYFNISDPRPLLIGQFVPPLASDWSMLTPESDPNYSQGNLSLPKVHCRLLIGQMPVLMACNWSQPVSVLWRLSLCFVYKMPQYLGFNVRLVWSDLFA